eukprot:TRINITY_DN436_c1_g1_i1.p1 TRINITY_DN436_c1_g1~~TRINITY_DN436_c1_g1_i1.p1  ORF type:complete len:294 (+),score=97.53 TRINITY_DN436_c1_g1_i1:206-1087(+)
MLLRLFSNIKSNNTLKNNIFQLNNNKFLINNQERCLFSSFTLMNKDKGISYLDDIVESTSKEEPEDEIMGEDDIDEDEIIDEHEVSPKSKKNIKVATARMNNVKGSRVKWRRLLHYLKGLGIKDAVEQCLLFPSVKYGEKTYKLILQAKANAVHNFGLEENRLVISKIWVNKARNLKRTRIRARGRMNIILKPRCHLFIEVEEIPKPIPGIDPPERRLGKNPQQTLHLTQKLRENWYEYLHKRTLEYKEAMENDEHPVEDSELGLSRAREAADEFADYIIENHIKVGKEEQKE